MKVKTNFEKIISLIRAKDERVLAKIQVGMLHGMRAFERQIVRQQMRKRPGLMWRTGTAARSWHVIERGAGDSYAVRLASSSKYLHIHQTGGTIRPRNARALTVPVHRDARGKRARDFSDLVFIQRKGGPPLLVRKRKTRFDVMYVLKRSVEMPKRLHVLESWRRGDALRLMNRAAKREILQSERSRSNV